MIDGIFVNNETFLTFAAPGQTSLNVCLNVPQRHLKKDVRLLYARRPLTSDPHVPNVS